MNQYLSASLIKQNSSKRFGTLSLILVTFLTITSLSLYTAPIASAAASATLSLTPSSMNVDKGANFQLTIKVTASTNRITGVQACITYDPNLLTLSNTNKTGSPLRYTTPGSTADCPSGNIQVSSFDFSKPSGTFDLAILTFTAKKSGSTATLSFNKPDSYIRDDATTDASGTFISILSGTSGSTVNIKNADGSLAPSPSNPTSTKNIAKNNTANQSLPTQNQASSADNALSPIIPISKTSAMAIKSKAKSNANLIVTIGAVFASLVITGLLVKLTGIGRLPFLAKSSHTDINATSLAAPMTEKEMLDQSISKVANPKIPQPSSVIHPTLPPDEINK